MHFKDPDRLKVKGREKIYCALSSVNSEHMKSAVAVLISDKLDLKIRNILRDKGKYFIMIKGLIH